ncbi:MAG: DNA topoisomerase (ATP-hydrolyzing) subunit B [Candidatus Micrarchaeia archaeon]
MDSSTMEYEASNIVVLEGPQGIRKRPAMYIGSTSSQGVLHLLFEIIDNAVDEALAGFCKNIKISITQDSDGNIAEVSDDGRGIPVEIMPKYNKSALEIIMTTLHKGAKFNNEVYKVSGGLHGVGLTVVNALSEFTEVTVKKHGKIYTQKFSRGIPVSKMEIIGETDETGTTIKFKPDKEIFKTTSFDSTVLKERLTYTSFLNPKLNIILKDDRFEQLDETKYYSENGLKDFIKFLNKNSNPITNIIHHKKSEGQFSIEYSLQYNDTYEERLESFVNSIKTPEGGTHVSGFHAAITRALINYTSKNKQFSKTELKISGEDVREGLSAVISILMQNPEFEGQTKEKLGNTQVRTFVETEVYASFSRYLEENPNDARAILEKAITAANARESAKRARELSRKRSVLENTVLPGKLADCIEDDPTKTEIFIVEGESAGGSSKMGRDKNTQAILPLRGKILNVEKASFEKIFENAEIKSLIAAFGTGIRETFNVENLRYHKIIIMTDADVDGSHIRTLLLTFFYRYMKKLIELGYVYIAQPPLYRVKLGKNEVYVYSDEELSTIRTEEHKEAETQRYKGLGEMNPEQLWETTMNPEKRMLKKMQIKDAQIADSLFSVLMGIDPLQRRRFLHDHSEEVNFLDV